MVPPRARWGGDHLGEGRWRARGPSYQRCRAVPTDPERRDRHQEARFRAAIALAQQRGELTPLLAGVLGVLPSFCDHDGRLKPIWPSLRQIAWRVRGKAWYGVETSDETADDGVDETGSTVGARTAGRWMQALGELGWVLRQHRYTWKHGAVRGTSNIWWLTIPTHLRDELEASEDARRSEALAGRRRGGRVTPRRGDSNGAREPAPSRHYAAAETRRQAADQKNAAAPVVDPGEVAARLADARDQLRRRPGPAPP